MNVSITRNRVTYTIKETAELLGVTEYTIRKAIWDGELKAQKLGRRWLIPASSISLFGNAEGGR